MSSDSSPSSPQLFLGVGIVPLLSLFAMGFLVLASYEISRATIESLFEGAHGPESVPLAWLVVAPSVLVTVLVYNRIIARTRLLPFFVGALIATLVVLLALLALYALDVPGVYYGLYVWKDIYIVVLIEMFWTFANSLFKVREARWLYGLFLVAGSGGAIAGGLSVGWLAKAYGSAGALGAVFPVLGLCIVVCLGLRRMIPPIRPPDKTSPPLGDSLKVLRGSAYLVLMLLLVVAVQIAINLVDYEYKLYLNEAFVDMDAKTAFRGQVNSAINLIALFLQLGSGPLLTALGVPRVLMGIPVLLMLALGAFAAAPRLATVAVAKVTSKALDYSLFRAAKEILYIPLSHAEKTRGKAIIDIMVYRMAKAGAALLILGLGVAKLGWVVTGATFGVVGGWIALTWLIVRRYKAVTVASDDDTSG
jgi:ATP:ADP antiporter, AAA family